MADRSRRIADSGVFQGFILVVIVLNAITLGVQTYDVSSGLESALTLVDEIFLGIFVVEIATRVAAFGGRPQDFVRDESLGPLLGPLVLVDLLHRVDDDRITPGKTRVKRPTKGGRMRA